jgi:hypothetical protein
MGLSAAQNERVQERNTIAQFKSPGGDKDQLFVTA